MSDKHKSLAERIAQEAAANLSNRDAADLDDKLRRNAGVRKAVSPDSAGGKAVRAYTDAILDARNNLSPGSDKSL